MYLPGKPLRKPPKLARGVCSTHRLLELAWREGAGQSSKVNVEEHIEGVLFVEVAAVGTGGGLLWLTVEISPDAYRWADRMTSGV